MTRSKSDVAFLALFGFLSGFVAGPLSAADELELEEIVVTATKRAQSVNDVPMTVQAFSGDELKNNGITNASELIQVVPGLTFALSPTNTPIFTMRGVGFNTSVLSSTSTIGLYVDELAYAYPYMTNGALFDIERIEVLKGPQGTLYGRNTTGGLVNFITNKPSDDLDGGLGVELGDFETTNIEGFLNLPISAGAALRLAGRYDRRGEGYQESVSRPGDKNGEKETLSLRANLRWDATDSLSVLLTTNFWQDSSDSVAGQIVGLNLDQPPFVNPAVSALQLDRNWRNDAADWDPGSGPFGLGLESDSAFVSVAARVDYQLSNSLSLVSLTGFNNVDRIDGNDFDGSAEEIFYLHSDGEIESFSQELRLVGSGERIEYIVGAYYSRDDMVDNQLGSYSLSSQGEFLRFLSQNVFDPMNLFYSPAEYADGFRLFRLNLQSESTSASVFGQIDFDVSDSVQLSAGLRYTDDQLESVSCSADYEGTTLPIWNTAVWIAGGNVPPGPVVRNGCMTLTTDYSAIADPNRTPLEEDNVSGRLSISYAPNDDWLLFASVSRGYKSGVWPVLTAANDAQLDAATQEKVTAYEIGSKVTLFGGAGQLNAAVFHYEYEDKQLQSEVEDLVFQTLPRLVNIPRSRVSGIEAELNAQLSESLGARFGVAYTDSEVEEFVGYRRLGQLEDFAGDEFPYTPEWQVTGSLNHDTQISPEWGLASNLSVSYRSDTSAAIGREQGFNIGSYSLVNADIALYSADEAWRVGLFAENLTDEYYWTSVDVQTDSVYRIPGLPRLFGIRFRYEF